MGKRDRARKRARQAVKQGERPTFEVDVARRVVPELPWVEFDGRRPPEIVEAARRSIAAEVGVRADQIQVDHVGGDQAGRPDDGDDTQRDGTEGP
jgi:hypothetical protein